MKRLALILALMLMPCVVIADSSQGDNNGKPFQELQAAVDAALAAEAAAREAADAAEASAREAADTAEAMARETADAAESAVRAAEDASLSARIAAEEVARIAADIALQTEIDAHAALLLDLDDRVSVLEGLHLDRSVTWTETIGWDVTDLSGDIAGLNYQLGEWIFIVSKNAATLREFGNCTNRSEVLNWLNAAVAGSNYVSNVPGGDSFFFNGVNWFNSPSFSLDVRISPSYNYIYIFGSSWGQAVLEDWNAYQEIYSYYSSGSPYAIGNTLTINVGSTRLDACGF